MAPTLKAIPLIVVGVLLNAGAQILLKKGLQAAGGLDLHAGALLRVLLQPWVLGGLAFYAVSVKAARTSGVRIAGCTLPPHRQRGIWPPTPPGSVAVV